jgi:hypothetical protein
MSPYLKKFIIDYNIAFENSVPLCDFAAYKGITESTVIRYVNKLKSEYGAALPKLKRTESEFSKEELENIFNQRDEVYDGFSGRFKSKIVDWTNSDKQVFIITCAQNATPIFKPAWEALLQYKQARNAEIIVIPSRYKNPTSLWSANNEQDEWWANPLTPFIRDNLIILHEKLAVCAHIKIQPTATTPLSGFDSYISDKSTIYGHPKIQLKTVPTQMGKLPKIITTTGMITVPNYTDTKTGAKGEFHHSYGAVIVEIDRKENIFHLRHIHFSEKDGSFYDLDKYYTTKGYKSNIRISGLVTGDSHAEFVDPNVRNATFLNEDSIVKLLKPKYVVYHDVEDFFRRNHHHRNNPIIDYCKYKFKIDDVEKGLQITADYIDENTHEGTINVIIQSNHDEALLRWLKEADPKKDPANAKFYHYMMYKLLDSVDYDEQNKKFIYPNPFKMWCLNPMDEVGLRSKEQTIFVNRDDSFMIEGVEVGFHGDKGADGRKGSVKSFDKIGVKTVIGHSHSPKIEGGCYQVGVSAKLDMEYVSGLSSWLHTHCIIYPDGKRTLVNIIQGKWKL